jgi:hypothetical protein
MGIPVKCPNGHQFSVKDKYAGKKGLCPYCEGQVMVRVPDALSSQDLRDAYVQAVQQDRKKQQAAISESSIFDDPHDMGDASASGSLLGSSVVRHHIRCKCGQSVPMWFAKCPGCGTYFDHR